jgi:catechol 2,3-dioxygenase-like lactoylglutathione lyase family enzyme
LNPSSRQPEAIMAITLNHTIVPARDKAAGAQLFAQIFGLNYEGQKGYFAHVKVNEVLTFLFSDESSTFESHHYAFHVTDAEFNAIFGRVKEAGLAYGGAPWSAEDGKLNDWGGGRGVYFKTPDGHLLELMTVPQ